LFIRHKLVHNEWIRLILTAADKGLLVITLVYMQNYKIILYIMTVVRPGKYTFYCLTNINQQVSVQACSKLRTGKIQCH
jgi:hypothetical protein